MFNTALFALHTNFQTTLVLTGTPVQPKVWWWQVS